MFCPFAFLFCALRFDSLLSNRRATTSIHVESLEIFFKGLMITRKEACHVAKRQHGLCALFHESMENQSVGKKTTRCVFATGCGIAQEQKPKFGKIVTNMRTNEVSIEKKSTKSA
jgi:hypothetical protein